MAATIRTSRTKSVVFFSENLDAVSSKEIDLQISKMPFFVDEIVFNFAELKDISSMGLRLVLKTQKMMHNRNGKFICTHIPPHIKHIFEMSGFIDKIVTDEKAAIICDFVTGKTASFSMYGDLEEDKASDFAERINGIIQDGVSDLQVNCKSLNSIAPNVYPVLTDIQKNVSQKKISFSLKNVSEQLQKDLQDRNLGVLFAERKKEIIPKNKIEEQILKKR